MNTVVTTNGSVEESLSVKINTDINKEVHHPFVVRYSASPADNIIHDLANIPIISLETPQIFEAWHGVSSTASSRSGPWQLYHNDQYLLAAVPNTLLDSLPVDQATEQAYSLILEQIHLWEYPYLVRTWNFFPDITSEGCANANNYQLFCTGRSRAYANIAIQPQIYPAATVIGTHQPGTHIYFIAAKQNGIGIENSQQVSAFEYPSSYSEDPPLFSRALLHRNHNQEILFISGTASITGHSTQFEGDINRQTEMCLNNIEHLVRTAILDHQHANITLQEFSQFKVYIKHPEHINEVRTHIQKLLGISAPVYYLQGDMCRSDLLVEIEALAITNTS